MKIPAVALFALTALSGALAQLPPLDAPDASLQGQACDAFAADMSWYTMGITCAIMSLDGNDPTTGVPQADIVDWIQGENPTGFSMQDFRFWIGNGVYYNRFDVQSDYTYKLNEHYASTGIAMALESRKNAAEAAAIAATGGGGDDSKSKPSTGMASAGAGSKSKSMGMMMRLRK